MDGAIPDGVNGHADLAIHRRRRQPLHLVRRGGQQPPVLRLTFERLEERRRLRAQRSIREDLDAAEAQRIVAESGLESHLEEGRERIFGQIVQHAWRELARIAQML